MATEQDQRWAAEAEQWLRNLNRFSDDAGAANAALCILGELERLRSENAALKAMHICYPEQQGTCMTCRANQAAARSAKGL